MTSYAAPQLLEDLKTRGFDDPRYEEAGYVIRHDPCGQEFYFTDHASPELVDQKTLLHTLMCREMR